MSNWLWSLLHCAFNLIVNSWHASWEASGSALRAIDGRLPMQAFWETRTTTGM